MPAATRLPRGLVLLLAMFAAGEARGARIEYAPTIVTTGDPAESRYKTPRGTGYDGVAELLVQSDAGVFGCTGVLLDGRRSVLTAAHCLTGGAGTAFPNLLVDAAFSWAGGAETLSSAQVSIYPEWSGDVRRGNDLALVHFPHLVSPLVQTYKLFTGPGELGADFEIAGFGMGGTGSEGRYTPLGTRRRGGNTFDATMTGTVDIFQGWTAGERVLMADFDNGTAANDGFGVFFRRPGLGLGPDEASIAPGDSGGPAFVDGRVAGLASFAARLRFGDGSSSDIDDVLNSSFGEFSGYTRVAPFASWIEAEAAIPEPSSAALICAGAFVLLLAGFTGRVRLRGGDAGLSRRPTPLDKAP